MGTIQRPKQDGNSLGSLQHQSTTTAGYKNGSSPRLRITFQVYSHGAKQPTMDGCRLWINRGIFLLWAWYVISRTSWSVRWKYCSVLGDTCTAGALDLTLRFCLFLFTCGGARRSISGTFSFLLPTTSENSHFKPSNTETAQSRVVWNGNLQFLRWSAVCLLSAVGLLFPNMPFRGFRPWNCS